MKKWSVWFSWYYEDFRPHGGCSAFIIEAETEPSKIAARKHLEDQDLAPCSMESVHIEYIEEYKETPGAD